MLSKHVRDQLEQLNRAPRTPKPGPVDRPSARREHTPSNGLADGQEMTTVWGSHWLVRQPLVELWPNGPRSIERALRSPPATDEEPDENSARLQRFFPAESVFLDLETCGLAGSIIFLAGVLHVLDGQLMLSQFWARDYSEEKPLLQSLWTLVGRARLLVTFNGKSFDWPQVQDRSTLHHLGQSCNADVTEGECHTEPSALTPLATRPNVLHFDLLHPARRRWKTQLPNCRLQTLERYICGRHRNGDIPGREIPAAYHEYVRTGNEQQVRSILHHNALDLVTLLQLTLTFASPQRINGPRVELRENRSNTNRSVPISKNL